MRQEVNIYQIAREAGVSPSTVSRVLSNSARVSEEKKTRVEAVVRKYNFRPNALAQGLSNTQTKTIGIIAADLENPFYSRIIVAIGEELNRQGYTPLIFTSLNDYELERKYLQRMFDIRVDAVILMGGRSDEQITDPDFADLLNGIADSIPIVTTGRIDGVNCRQIQLDEVNGVDLAMQHLFDLGHRHIAMIGGWSSARSTYEKRLRYRSILKKNGITYRERYVMESDYNIEGGYRCMIELLEANRNRTMPTAVIAINDFSAVGVEHAIQDRGLRIPEDMAVVSFDNTYIAETIMPKLTSIGYDYNEYGAMLASSAISMAEGGDVPLLQTVPPSLHVRSSTQTK